MTGIGLSTADDVSARAVPLPEADAAVLRRYLSQPAS
jgi:hypothetical protein